MPFPIMPLHIQENMPMLFGDNDFGQPEFPISDIQFAILSPTAADRKPKKIGNSIIKALTDIDSNTNLVVTAVSEGNERYCSVPGNIDDNTLLSLKADGLVVGNGRSVKITERGRVALRDHYLNSKNALADLKKADKFDYRAVQRISKDQKQIKTASNKSTGIFKKPH